MPNIPDRLVISVGGNALTLGKGRETIEDQRAAAQTACAIIAKLWCTSYETAMAVTHGNGPQVGFILERFEHALRYGILHNVPLDAINADTQGAIGFMLELLIDNEMRRIDPSIAGEVATLVTRVLVDPNDKAFQYPTKPIGSWMTEEQAMAQQVKFGWTVKRMSDKRDDGYRRVVPSPVPLELVNVEAIKSNVDNGFLTICGGGGGIPVARNPDGTLRGVEGVIDKDRTTALVAEAISARLMAILTAVRGVIDPEEFKTHGVEGSVIPELDLSEARDILPSLQAGSMGPKLGACINFTERTGEPSLITDFAHAERAITEGRGGTRIVV